MYNWLYDFLMDKRTVVGIDGIPTAIISRGENTPPIILYTVPPPPYYKHAEFELIQAGEAVVVCPNQVANVKNNEDDVQNLFWFKCVIMFVILMIIGTGLIGFSIFFKF